MSSLFITATGTNVGKTHTTLKLIEALAAKGHSVGVYKPIETGVTNIAPDATILLKACQKVNETPPPVAPTPTPPPAPTDCVIKGNINWEGEKIYHLPGCASYDRTKIDESRGERWFCSEEEAVAAGWRKAKNCPR